MVDEVDIDADEFHQLSKQLSFIDIKKALRHKFRPEQIARFGNTHIIYPCLSQSGYEALITKKVDEIVDLMREATGIKLKICKSVNDSIYVNGVFPTQGARPVFTTIRELLENNLPKILLFAAEKGVKSVSLTCDKEENLLVGKTSKGTVKLEYKGRIEALKSEYSVDEKAVTAVHEAGHALLHGLMFGVAPTSLKISSVSGHKAGFMTSISPFDSLELLEKNIMVGLAGREAEIAVFGEEMSTAGATGDIHDVTSVLAKMVREAGMKVDSPIAIRCESDVDPTESVTDLGPTNKVIELEMKKYSQNTKKLIEAHFPILLRLTQELMESESLSPSEFIDIFAEFDLTITKPNPEDEIIPEYGEILDRLFDEYLSD
jgi:cell division protease FtsH